MLCGTELEINTNACVQAHITASHSHLLQPLMFLTLVLMYLAVANNPLPKGQELSRAKYVNVQYVCVVHAHVLKYALRAREIIAVTAHKSVSSSYLDDWLMGN